jgi:hypothetical protein
MGHPYPASNSASKSFAFSACVVDYVIRIMRAAVERHGFKFQIGQRDSE